MQSSFQLCLRTSLLRPFTTLCSTHHLRRAAPVLSRLRRRNNSSARNDGHVVHRSDVEPALLLGRSTTHPDSSLADLSNNLKHEETRNGTLHGVSARKQGLAPEVWPHGAARTEGKVSTNRPRSRVVHTETPGLTGTPATRRRRARRERKAELGTRELPTEQRASGEIEPFMDIEYIRSHLEYPTRAQYPHLPSSLFEGDVVSALHGSLGVILRLETKHGRSSASVHGRSRCIVTGKLPNGEVLSAVGIGDARASAATAAYAHLLLKLHIHDMLKKLFPDPLTVLAPQVLSEEKNAKIDIYNYAARFGLVPEFSYRTLRRLNHRKKKTSVEATVELKEQGITAVARAPDKMGAEIAASVKFKAEAERYHAEHGEESIVIKDNTALNTGNVKSFFDFYKMRNPGTFFDVKIVQSQDADFEGNIELNGKLIGSASVRGKKAAEEVAWLVAAVTLMRENTRLLEDFQAALSHGKGTILPPVRPIDIVVDTDAVSLMQEAVANVRRVSLPHVKGEATASEKLDDTKRLRERTRLSREDIATRSKMLKQRMVDFLANPSMTEKRMLKESLPMSQSREKVLTHIGDNTYSVIVGATGSGKTTQVPQILLEDAISSNNGATCNVLCTQPRRIAATSIARRVASERNEQLQDTVGYQVRFDARLPQPGGSITYCTTGILLQQLQRAPNEMFDTVSHIIIDEVHERDILIDFLMIILKKTMQARRTAGRSVPKVVLMSATIDSELFADYFEEVTPNGELLPCPSLSIPGRTFPVKERYLGDILAEMSLAYRADYAHMTRNEPDTRDYIELETSLKGALGSNAATQEEEAEATIDWKRERTVTRDGQVVNEKEDAIVPVALIAFTLAHIARTTSEGAILVFLPGYDEIKKVTELLQRTAPLGVDFSDEVSFKLSMLHSSIPAAEQAEVFNPVPKGCRKIILSTNIAETSVTIPDIQYVVDSGKLREKRYDQLSRITKLQCTWISKSNAKQRAGRAGRVQNGNYFALFSKARFESLRAIGMPEMLRSDLQEICLDIKAQAFESPIRDFLSESIEPPSPAAVDASLVSLEALGALTMGEQLTALGRLLASLPVHPSLGKMIVLGVIFRCLDPMIILGAAMNERSPFYTPPDRRREAREAHMQFLEGTGSDHMAVLNAIRYARRISHTRDDRALRYTLGLNHIHSGTVKTILHAARQIEEVLVEAGLIPYTAERDRFEHQLGNASLNRNSKNSNIIKALTLAGVHPNLAVSKGYIFRTPREKTTVVHPSSLNTKRGRSNTSESHNVGPEVYSPGSLVSYSTLAASNDGRSLMLRDTTCSSPMMATLFGGRLESQGNIIKMDDWLPFFVRSPQSGSFVGRKVIEFRQILDQLLAAAFLDLSKLKARNRNRRSDEEPMYLADDAVRETFATAVVDLLAMDPSKATAPSSTGRNSSTKRW